MFFTMNDLVMRFLLVLAPAININIHTIVLKKVDHFLEFIDIEYLSCPIELVIASESRLENMNVQSDSDPLRIVRPADQNVHYKQQVNVRFLEPPAAPEPAPIIIRVCHYEFLSSISIHLYVLHLSRNGKRLLRPHCRQ
jgi:hypothetical protein